MLAAAEPWVAKIMHPTVIISAYNEALKDATEHLKKISFPLDDNRQLLDIVKSSVGTKFISRYGDHLCQLAIDAVKTVSFSKDDRQEIDIKRYVRIEKVLDSCSSQLPNACFRSLEARSLIARFSRESCSRRM